MSASIENVTRERRDLILTAVAFLYKSFAHGRGSKGATVPQINEVLKEWMANGVITWPAATWSSDVKHPYQGGTYQHLKAMLRQGRVEQDKQARWLPASNVSPLRRRAEEALRLKSEGKNGIEIAEALGISRSLAYSLINDPRGEGEKKRKRGYCPACGAKKRPEATACRNCSEKAQEKAAELLPPTTFTVYIERGREHGYELLFGVTTELQRVIRVGVGRGFFDHPVRHDLSWLDALTELEADLGVPLVQA